MATAAVKNSPFGTTELDTTKAPNLSAVKDGVGGITGMDTIAPREPKPFRITGEQLISEASKPIGYTKEDYMKAVTPGLKELEGKSRELGEFSAMEKEQQARSKAEATRMRGEAITKQKEAITGSPEYAQMQEITNKMAGAEFVPTKDTAKDLAGLFSLVSVIGYAIGGGSKENSMQALNAMDGMLSGYQKGRADLYKREKDVFETNFKALKVKSDALSTRLKQIGELAALDTQAANAEADAYLAEQDANFVKMYKDKYGLPATIKYLENLNTAVGEAEKIQMNLVAKAQERKLSAMGEVYKTQSAMDLAAIKAEGKGGNKPSAAQQKIYIDKNVLLKEFTDLQRDLQNPRLRKLIDDNRVASFLTEEGGKISSQLMQKQIPEDLRNFLIKANKLRNAYYLDQSGKAVTGAEAMRNYGVVPNPGDTSQATAQKIDQMIEGLNTTIKGYQSFYSMPDISAQIQSGQILKAPTQRGESAFGSGGAAYSIGQIIERGNKKYRIVGGDMNDPDVEEVE
jgi:hypothetical protein